MDIIQHTTQYQTRARRRLPPLGVVLHNTVTRGLVAPHPNGSWHYEVDRDGACHQYVADKDYAWHVRICDEWRPPWCVHRDTRVSEMNSCSVGIELVSYAGATNPPPEPGYVAYTDPQYATLEALLRLLRDRYGDLPIVTHGAMQLDRTDPVALNLERLPLTWAGDGWRLEDGTPMDTTWDERQQYKPYFEQLGVAVNTETALMQRAALAHKRDETPGPAMSGEYPFTLPDGRGVIRQDFTARICEYDPATGGTAWAEVVKERPAA